MRARILRLLVRRGLLSPDTGMPEADADADLPPLAELYAASVRQLLTTGERAGKRPLRVRSAATVPPRVERSAIRGARLDGFDLHAGTAVRPSNRARLERLCRYLLRPPVTDERLSESQGLVLLRLPHPWNDGSTQLALTPTEIVERLAALVPRPHVNLVLYHGVLSANARLRSAVVRHGRPLSRSPRRRPTSETAARNPTWAQLMQRGLDLDVLSCPQCAGRMKHIATILEPTTIRRILEHLGIDPAPKTAPLARAPPPSAAPSVNALRTRLRRLADHT